mgnify:CR=1 FL=1
MHRMNSTRPYDGSMVRCSAQDDALELWQLAIFSDSKASPGTYIPWCRDFWRTSAAATGASGEVKAFILGHISPVDTNLCVVGQFVPGQDVDVSLELLEHFSGLVVKTKARSFEAAEEPQRREALRAYRSFAELRGFPSPSSAFRQGFPGRHGPSPSKERASCESTSSRNRPDHGNPTPLRGRPATPGLPQGSERRKVLCASTMSWA